MTPVGPPHIEAFSLIKDDEFLEIANQYDALNVRIKRPVFSHVISAMMMINDEKVDGFYNIWLWLHSDKVVIPMGVDLLVSDIEGMISIEDEENPFTNTKITLNLKPSRNE